MISIYGFLHFYTFLATSYSWIAIIASFLLGNAMIMKAETKKFKLKLKHLNFFMIFPNEKIDLDTPWLHIELVKA